MATSACTKATAGLSGLRGQRHGQVVGGAVEGTAGGPPVDAQHADRLPHRRRQETVIVDVQGVARGADLDRMIARHVETVRKPDRRRSAGANVHFLLLDPPPVHQQFHRLTLAGLATEVLQLGLQLHAAADGHQRIGRAEAGDGQVFRRRLPQVDQEQHGRLGQLLGLLQELGRGGLRQLRRPGHALQVGEKVDFMPDQPRILAPGAVDDLPDRAEWWPAGRRWSAAAEGCRSRGRSRRVPGPARPPPPAAATTSTPA